MNRRQAEGLCCPLGSKAISTWGPTGHRLPRALEARHKRNVDLPGVCRVWGLGIVVQPFGTWEDGLARLKHIQGFAI